MKVTLFFILGLIIHISFSQAATPLVPKYYSSGGTSACAQFLKQEHRRYFGSPGDKSIVICAHPNNTCEINIIHRFSQSSGGNIWIRVNSSEAFLALNFSGPYYFGPSLKFSCPEKELVLQFALEKNSEWDNNEGQDYKLVLKR